MKITLWIKLANTGRWNKVDTESVRQGDKRFMAQIKQFIDRGELLRGNSPEIVADWKVAIT